MDLLKILNMSPKTCETGNFSAFAFSFLGSGAKNNSDLSLWTDVWTRERPTTEPLRAEGALVSSHWVEPVGRCAHYDFPHKLKHTLTA